MAKRPRVLIKYKILVLLTLVPLITLLIYMYFVTNTFKKDKIAYVYDSSLAIAKTNAAQVRGRFEALLAQMIPISIGYRKGENYFASVSQDVFKKNQALTRMLAFELAPGKTKKAYIKAELKKKINEPEVPEDLIKRAVLGTESGSIFIELSQTESNRSWLGFRTLDGILVLGDLALPDLKDLFSGSSLFDSMILTADGKIMASSKSESGNITELFESNLALKNMLTQANSAGAAELKSKKGEPYIGSYSAVGVGGLSTLSLIKTEDAMLTLVYLYRKSFIFFIAMISAALVLSVLASVKLTGALRKLYLAVQKIGQGDFTIRVTDTSNDEVGVLATTFNEMAEQISNLVNERIHKARMEKELEAGRTVQSTLFPVDSATLDGLEVHGFYQPATECGGDWWHYYECEGKVLLLIGDATGHGVPAALVTSAACASVAVFKNLKETDPARLMSLLNSSIFQSTKGEIQMTFFLGVYDKRLNTLSYCNASHPAPLLCSPARPTQTAGIELFEIKHLNAPLNPRLGEKLTVEFESAKVSVSPGDILLCFTDGVTDLANPSGRSLGYKKFYKQFTESLGRDSLPKALRETLLKDLWKYRDSAELVDDVTFFVAKMS